MAKKRIDIFSVGTLGFFPFIKEKMPQYGEEYNEDDFDAFLLSSNIVYVAMIDNVIHAFACLVLKDDKAYLTYTWSDGTINGKKCVSKGIRYIINKYRNILMIGEHGMKLNILREGRI